LRIVSIGLLNFDFLPRGLVLLSRASSFRERV
jgi:hypothetical protein